MNITVKRFQPSPTGLSWPGELLIDDVHFCWTVERGPKVQDHPPIPFGSFSGVVNLSPHLQYPCPLLSVPNREGIRLHVANFWHELEGCTAVGMLKGLEPNGQEFAVFSSRAALDALLRVLPESFVVTYCQGVAQ